MGIDELKNSFNSLQDLYVRKNGKQANADELINYARSQTTDIFATWDKLFDDDDKVGNGINSKTYYADGDNLLFQSETGEVTAFNLNDGSVRMATNQDMATMLDALDDDSINRSISAEMINNSKLKLGSDQIDFFESLNLLNKEVKTEDKNNSKIIVSSSDTQQILAEMANRTGCANIHELMQKFAKDPNSAKEAKSAVSDYLLNVFGNGDAFAALKKLTDAAELPKSEEVLQQAFDKATGLVFENIVNSFTDKSKTNHDINFVLGDINASQTDLSSVKIILQNQVDKENNNIHTMSNQQLQAIWDSGQRPAGIGDEIHKRYYAGDTKMHDPMGFNVNGARFDFVEDENNDGKFNGMEEFVGFDKGWKDLTKYDTNNDGVITDKELEQLKVLVTDEKTGKTYFDKASNLGIDEVNLKSYQEKNEVNKDGNFLAGLFNVLVKNKEILAEQTYDTEEYLKNKYGSSYGTDIGIA